MTIKTIGNPMMKISVGDKIHNWTVLGFVGGYVQVRCVCGNERAVTKYALKTDQTKSCGCRRKEYIRNNKLIDLSGKRFGQLRAIKKEERRQRYTNAVWVCSCSCGALTTATSLQLRKGLRTWCGKFSKHKRAVLSKYQKVANFSFWVS